MRTLIQPPNPKLKDVYASRFTDASARFNWNSAIKVEPIKRDKMGEIIRPFGLTIYPNGAIEQFS